MKKCLPFVFKEFGMFERKKFFIIIICMFSVVGILIIYKINTGKDLVKNDISITDESTEVLNEMRNSLENKENKIAIVIDGEEISEKEIAFIDFQINNKYVNDGNEKNAVDETIKEYAILKDAKKCGIAVTDEENKNMQEQANKLFSENTDDLNYILEIMGMSSDEFLDFYIDQTKKQEVISKWEIRTINLITKGEIKIENEEFNNIYTEFVNNDDVSKKHELLMKLLKRYEEYLITLIDVNY